jgi:hypothetical protein
MEVELDAAIAQADAVEGALLKRLTGHPVLRRAGALSRTEIAALLLQRRFISMIFTPVYDMGIDALTGSDALHVAREIVREEYPAGRKSHREDLVDDLLTLGLVRSDVLASRPTAATLATIGETLELMADATTDDSGVRVLAMLRFWGEVVVSVEYGVFWSAMKPWFDAADRASSFYFEHYSHDGCEQLATASTKTHSGRLGVCLRDVLRGPAALAGLTDVETRAVHSRERFYDQFRRDD